MVEFIQSVWDIGWPVRWVIIITPILIMALVFGYWDMRRTEGDLHRK